jgi:hypothetical protein
MKKVIDAESKMEPDFWKTASEAENIAILAKIARLRRKGVDIDYLFDRLISENDHLRGDKRDDL